MKCVDKRRIKNTDKNIDEIEKVSAGKIFIEEEVGGQGEGGRRPRQTFLWRRDALRIDNSTAVL